MFDISSDCIKIRLSDVQKSDSIIEENLYAFLKAINNSVDYVRGNNDTGTVTFFFVKEITEEQAEELVEFLRKK